MHHSVAVELGTTLKAKRLTDNLEQTFTIVGSEEADLAAGKISYLSPIGSSLLGKKKGEEVAVHTPKGEVRYKITSID